MTSKEKTLRADARRNREKVFVSARELFAQEGDAASIEEIAAHAGVGIGTVYRHFPTKQDLLTEMVRVRFSRFTEIALEAEQLDDPYESLEFLVLRSAEEVEDDAGFQLAMMGSDQPRWEGIEEEKAQFAEVATRIIDRAVESGAIRDDLTFQDFPMLMCGITSTMYFSPGGSTWRRHVDLMLAGLRNG